MNSLAVMLCIIILLLLPATLSGADPLYTFCSPEAINYTSKSNFESNLKQLLGLLSDNTSTSILGGFYNDTIGTSPDIVYGQALCRGDVNTTVCQNCVTDASQEIFNSCNSTDALIWYEFCQVRYSYQMFFSSMVYTGKYPDQNNKAKNVSNPQLFGDVLRYLMKNLSGASVFSPPKSMFATGGIKFSGNRTIYGLQQCTRDISGTDCKNCLLFAMGDLSECCSSHQGGTVVSRNCNVRFELDDPFFNDTTSTLLLYPSSKGDKMKTWKVVIASASTALFAVLVVLCAVQFRLKKKLENVGDEERSSHELLDDFVSPAGVTMTEEGRLVTSEELPFIDVASIRIATDDFSELNKLGQGGFGTVYKGLLSDGKEVAVKRLSRKSWQGLEEFKNEVILIAKLQHKNLVRLVACGFEGEEKLLLYEFMPNSSLDTIIFDSERRSELNWKTYYRIIEGIARGLLYLHEDSRLKIIHRDLKPSNVLLDQDMVAKISDFGMARIFGENQNTANTKRVVGTYGYMAPEYAMEGLFSVKSDVFSFGVILLEIISGKRNSGFYLTELARTLLAYAWKLWKEGKELEFVEPCLMESCPAADILRCMQIGLLCVQEDPEERPTMSTVVVLLGSDSIDLPEPKKPAIFAVSRMAPLIDESTSNPTPNGLTLSIIMPRTCSGVVVADRNFFATKESNIKVGSTLYSLGQCMKDLSAADCSWCLQVAVEQVVLMQFQAGRFLFPSCNIVYGLSPFVEENSATTSPPPQRAAGRRELLSKIIIASIVVASVVVISMSFWFLIGRKLLKQHNNQPQENAGDEFVKAMEYVLEVRLGNYRDRHKQIFRQQ